MAMSRKELLKLFKESKLGTLSALEQDTFLRIMMRESSMKPNVKPGDQGVITKHRTGKMLIDKKTGREYPEIEYIVSKTEKAPKKKWAYGLFQISGTTFEDSSSGIQQNAPHIKTYKDLADPKNNMEAAYWLYMSRQKRFDKGRTKYDGFLPWSVQLGGGVSEYEHHQSAISQYDLSDKKAVGVNRRKLDKQIAAGIVRPQSELAGRGSDEDYVEDEDFTEDVDDSEEEIKDDKYKIPKEKSKIRAWMKKHDWKGSDIGKMVDGKWKGYHPGDTMTPKKEESSVGAAGAEVFLENESKPVGSGPGYAAKDPEESYVDEDLNIMSKGLRETKAINAGGAMRYGEGEHYEDFKKGDPYSDITYSDPNPYSEDDDDDNITSEWTNLGGGGPVEGEEPEKKSKNELLRERQRLEAQLRKHGISYKFKKKEKKEKGLTIDELIDMPFQPLHHGGPVNKYFEGGPSLDQGTGGGQMSDSGLFDEMSSEEVITWRKANTGSLSPEDRESVNQLIIKKKKIEGNVEKNKSVLDDRPRGAADSTPLPVKFQTQSRTNYPGEEPGEWGELEDVKEPERGFTPPKEEALMTDTTKLPSSVEPSIMEATVEDSFRIEAEAKAKADKKKEEDIQPKKTQKELDLERQRDAQKKDAAYMDMQKDLIKSQIKAFNDEQEELVKIDPDRYWKSKGTISKIVAILGSAAGGYISGRYGGPNEWLGMIDKEVNRDIDAQKLDRDNQIKRKAASFKRIEMLTKHYQFMTKDKTAQKNLELIEAKIKTERMKISVKYNREKLAANDSILMKNGLTDETLAIMDVRYPKQNIRKRAVKSTKDGKWYVFNDHDAKKKAMVSVVEGEKAISSISELIDLTKKISFGTAVPGFMHGFDKDLTKVKVLRESLKGALRLEIFGPGVMTDTERALAEKIIGDPTKFFTFDSSQIEMLQTLKRKINYGIRQQLIRGGINIPPSQNDLAVKQYLASKGWRPTEENKAKTINALIKLEDKHQTGRYWVENETIPL
jgi:ribosomal protein S15P/S13E